MTRLSTNINKVALLRNARGGNVPNVVRVAEDCIAFGTQGITVHPRPDGRHIRYADVRALKAAIGDTELNVEGYPTDEFMALMDDVRPAQCTLVPDPPGVLTSSAGWDTIARRDFLIDIVGQLKSWGIRTSLFIETDTRLLDAAQKTGTDRIEFYTGPYAEQYPEDSARAVAPYVLAAQHCHQIGLGINAGHRPEHREPRVLRAKRPACAGGQHRPRAHRRRALLGAGGDAPAVFGVFGVK